MSLDEKFIGWISCWMKLSWLKVSLDESVKIGWKCFGWKCHWMKSCLDESVIGWNRVWMKVSVDEIDFGWKCILPLGDITVYVLLVPSAEMHADIPSRGKRWRNGAKSLQPTHIPQSVPHSRVRNWRSCCRLPSTSCTRLGTCTPNLITGLDTARGLTVPCNGVAGARVGWSPGFVTCFFHLPSTVWIHFLTLVAQSCPASLGTWSPSHRDEAVSVWRSSRRVRRARAPKHYRWPASVGLRV